MYLREEIKSLSKEKVLKIEEFQIKKFKFNKFLKWMFFIENMYKNIYLYIYTYIFINL